MKTGALALASGPESDRNPDADYYQAACFLA